ncbi:MAG: hypothetical protein HS101_07370 [Planctomycetia bacterium]|jgi:hypothetical protein|nr:hypothetical protein [Planctomycetia bacterium]MCC7313644.1 hypothetical protein [Planctomycetota bacterium]OQZ04285.1 MAG: hypothetical protein B6D36_12025 [Planctomycetes bacterium UTPLA1]
MLKYKWSIVIAFSLSIIGCGEQEKQKWDDFWQKGSLVGIGGGHRAGDVETWTIECNEYRGERHAETADALASSLKRVSGLRPDLVTVQHDKDRSRVFYGSYELKYVEAKVDGERYAQGDVIVDISSEVKTDLDFIRKLAIGDQYPFFSARPIPQPRPDVGPTEWDLRNARGFYTLHVGVTYPTPSLHDYKAAAVEWVKDLRDRGHEAYYYHDPDKAETSICVGTFGEDALVDTGDGRTGYSPAVKALRGKEELKYNLENGHIVQRIATDENGKQVKMPNWSFLVKIPRQGEDAALRSPESR